MREMAKEAHTPETEEYGIASFVYERFRPFEPARFMKWMENWPEQVVRAKGIIWLATRNSVAHNLSQAGPSVQIGPAGYWAAALPEEERAALLTDEAAQVKHWDDRYGDRLNKVVFIGIDMDRERISKSLDRCLLTDQEMLSDWSLFEDRLPNV
ncbi:putative metal chaperone YciC [compost metagenome]